MHSPKRIPRGIGDLRSEGDRRVSASLASEYARRGAEASIRARCGASFSLRRKSMRRWVTSGGMSSAWRVRAMLTVSPIGVHEAHAGGTQVQVDLEGPGSLGRKLSGDVVHEELDALVAARHVGDEFHARSLSSGPAGHLSPSRPDRNTGSRADTPTGGRSPAPSRETASAADRCGPGCGRPRESARGAAARLRYHGLSREAPWR